MAVTKEKKSFKKYARKHLATIVHARRTGAKAKKEKMERVERRKTREAKSAAKEEQEHQEQLDRLKEDDPQFYSYLEEEDPTLLQFGRDDIDIVDDAEGSDAETDADDEEKEDGDEKDDDEEGTNKEEGETALPRVSRKELTQMISDKKLPQLVDIFLSAAREMGYAVKEQGAGSKRKFDEPSLVKDSLLKAAHCVGQNLSLVVNAKGAVKNAQSRTMLRRLLKCLVLVLTESGDSDPTLSAGILHALAPFVPLLHFVHGLTKSVLKMVLGLCANSSERIRLAAYVVVRAIATRAAGTRSLYQSTAFKGVFLALVRSAHQYTIHNMPAIAFLMNCVVDLYGTDMEAAYQHAFVYLRQLAIYLRAVLQQQTQSNVRAVFNWQFVIALRTWGLVVSTYAEPSQLGPLIHPVVQIALGIMDLFSSPRMFPMHLHVIEMLNHISARADGVYVPVAPYLMRIITSPSLGLSAGQAREAQPKRQRDGAITEDDVDMRFLLRTKKSHVKSSLYKVAVWNEALYLLAEHLAVHSNSIGFPEAFWAVEATLRKLKKDVKLPRINSTISNILRHMETRSKQIAKKREGVSFGPCDLTAVKMFEDELKMQAKLQQKGSGGGGGGGGGGGKQEPANPLADYHRSLRQTRVDAFTAKQASKDDEKGTANGRTLESVVDERSGSKKKRRTEPDRQ
jgi:nucleolar complex protein 2